MRRTRRPRSPAPRPPTHPAPAGAVPRPGFRRAAQNAGLDYDSSRAGAELSLLPTHAPRCPRRRRASCCPHLASPGAAGGSHAAARAPGLALRAMAAAPRGGAGAQRRQKPSGHESLGLAARLQVSTRALLCNTPPEEREPRAPRKSGRAHKQSHVASGPGGRAKRRRLFRQQSPAASGRG